jgi:hypothetical protein
MNARRSYKPIIFVIKQNSAVSKFKIWKIKIHASDRQTDYVFKRQTRSNYINEEFLKIIFLLVMSTSVYEVQGEGRIQKFEEKIKVYV